MKETMVETEFWFQNPLNTYLLEERRYFKRNVTPWKCSMASVWYPGREFWSDLMILDMRINACQIKKAVSDLSLSFRTFSPFFFFNFECVEFTWTLHFLSFKSLHSKTLRSSRALISLNISFFCQFNIICSSYWRFLCQENYWKLLKIIP